MDILDQEMLRMVRDRGVQDAMTTLIASSDVTSIVVEMSSGERVTVRRALGTTPGRTVEGNSEFRGAMPGDTSTVAVMALPASSPAPPADTSFQPLPASPSRLEVAGEHSASTMPPPPDGYVWVKVTNMTGGFKSSSWYLQPLSASSPAPAADLVALVNDLAWRHHPGLPGLRCALCGVEKEPGHAPDSRCRLAYPPAPEGPTNEEKELHLETLGEQGAGSDPAVPRMEPPIAEPPLSAMPPLMAGDEISWVGHDGTRRSETIPRQLLDWANAVFRHSLVDTLKRNGEVIWRRHP